MEERSVLIIVTIDTRTEDEEARRTKPSVRSALGAREVRAFAAAVEEAGA